LINYSKLPLLTIQAVKEQQEQIEDLRIENLEQRKQNNELRKQVADLKTVVCALKPDAAVCSEKEKK